MQGFARLPVVEPPSVPIPRVRKQSNSLSSAGLTIGSVAHKQTLKAEASKKEAKLTKVRAHALSRSVLR